MTTLRLLMLSALTAALAGCIGLKTGGEGVFPPTAVQPPPSERGAGSRMADTEIAPAPSAEARPRSLAVPSR